MGLIYGALTLPVLPSAKRSRRMRSKLRRALRKKERKTIEEMRGPKRQCFCAECCAVYDGYGVCPTCDIPEGHALKNVVGVRRE